MKYILAHDLGTSGNKAVLFSTDGELIKSRVSPYATHFFHGTWAEQNPEDWWKAVCLSTQELLEGVDASKIQAVSFSGHMMGCLCVDQAGRPLRPHILYCDTRSMPQVEEVMEKIDLWTFYTITGHRASPSYTLEKLMWVRDNEPDIYRQTYKVLNAKDYIVHRLTGAFGTDYSDAGGTEAFNIVEKRWSDKVCDCVDIDPDKFPPAHESIDVAGEVTAEAAGQTGIPAGTPVCWGAGDGCACGVGAGSIDPGSTYTSMGSSAWVGATTKEPIFDSKRRVPTFPHAVPGLYHSCGVTQTAGASFSWAARTLGCVDAQTGRPDYGRIDHDVLESGPGAGGVLFLPYLMGERSPWWDNDARGCWLGMTQETGSGDLLRAVEEGVAFNLRAILDIYKDHMNIDAMGFVGGGAKSPIWRSILADVFGLPVDVPRNIEECGAMGAAIIAGVGVGIYSGFDQVRPFFEVMSRQVPVSEHTHLYEERFKLFLRSYEALRPVFPQLAKELPNTGAR